MADLPIADCSNSSQVKTGMCAIVSEVQEVIENDENTDTTILGAKSIAKVINEKFQAYLLQLGIDYWWADATARNAQVGMTTGEQGFQNDTNAIYEYDGAAWNLVSDLNTFADNLFRIYDDADITKQLAFDVSGITTATTRTITVPDENVNLGHKMTVTSEVINEGQNWNGVAYVDPDAIGANPTAKIYPDGTVVGSTDNGDYTKYPNGDLEIRGKRSGTLTLTTASGSVFYGTAIVFTFPMAFVDNNPDVTVEILNGGGGFIWSSSNTSDTTSLTAYTARVLSPSSRTGVAHLTTFTAKGRWK